MGLMDKVKNFINASEEEYIEDVNTDNQVSIDTKRPNYENFPFSGNSISSVQPKESASKIVDIRPHVVFKKLDRFDDVGDVADVLNEKRIVVLNLETCPPDVSRRVIDFLYGVVYANKGDLKRIAGRAYIITPYNVPVTGELLDEVDATGFSSTF